MGNPCITEDWQLTAHGKAVKVITYAGGIPIKAAVADPRSNQAIIASLGPDGWEALYALTADGRQASLPQCFELNDAALAALTDAV